MTHKAIKKVTEDIERYHFNTAIAAIMEFVNYLYQAGALVVSRQAIETLIVILSPFTPHAAEELWGLTGKTTSILKQAWPVFDPQLIVEDAMQIVIQVNGKLRDQITVPVDANEDEIKSKAQGAEKVVQHIQGKTIKKIIYVPKKLVNIVV
jgi:leucyl-tRNA synthetase